jgi:hypothetical protein
MLPFSGDFSAATRSTVESSAADPGHFERRRRMARGSSVSPSEFLEDHENAEELFP